MMLHTYGMHYITMIGNLQIFHAYGIDLIKPLINKKRKNVRHHILQIFNACTTLKKSINQFCLLNIIAALQLPKPEAVFRQFCKGALYNVLQIFTGLVTPRFLNPKVGNIRFSFIE